MNVKPMGAPAPQAPSTAATDARSRAIAVLQGGGQSAQAPVQNQNNIAPEEVSAIHASDNKQGDDIVESNQVDTNTEETTTPEPTEAELQASRRYAQLARQEKALRAKAMAQEQQWKAKEAELQAREAAITKQPTIDRSQYFSKDDIKNNALDILAQAGVSYEELTNQMINPVQSDPRVQAHIAKLEAKLAEIEERNQTTQKSYEEQQTQAYQAAVKQIEMDTKALVAKDPSFEAIKHARAEKEVVKLIEQTYHQDGILLSVEEAAQQVEDYLVDEYTKLSNIGKIKQRMAQASATQKPAVPAKTQGTPQDQKQPQPMKTLTNATSSTRQLSAKERAVLAFKGQLKT